MGGRAVEGTGLENRQRGNPFVGSNPTPSATNFKQAIDIVCLLNGIDFSSPHFSPRLAKKLPCPALRDAGVIRPA
jgi:hypothetical protein